MSARLRYKPHPASAVLPLLEGEAFEALVADIKANGLFSPITLLGGKFLTAAIREQACCAAGVESRFVEFVGDDPIAIIISANIERKHLDKSRRAMRAERLATLHFMARRDMPTLRRGSAIEGTTRARCSSEATTPRRAHRVIQAGARSERPRRVRRCDFNGLLMSGSLISRRADHDSAGDQISGSIALRRERHLRGRRRRPRGRKRSLSAAGHNPPARSVMTGPDTPRRRLANDNRRLPTRYV